VINDVLIVGAGPAGSVAAAVLARAGARVRLFDRATFPREKLCGDTVNPGTLAILRRLGMAASIEERGLRVDGMRVTGERGVAIEGRYPRDLSGRALRRCDLDWALLQQAIAAGAQFEAGAAVRRALIHQQGVAGVAIGRHGSEHELHARVTIAADGRRSTIAFGLGVARHPEQPRRWAIGAYYENAAGVSTLGEMHIRRGRYIGVAAVPGGLTNVCLVKPFRPGDAALRDRVALLQHELARDSDLRHRFANARLVQPPVMLGPLAIDVTGAAIDGLLLAGDAAGFIDPMTGDGMRFAVRGAELAATAALDALEHGWTGVHHRLAERRRSEFAGKWRFNRVLRALVGSPRAVEAAALGASLAPGVLRAMIAHAGDCSVADR
jgi:flavin-dependent dehydrogenase